MALQVAGWRQSLHLLAPFFDNGIVKKACALKLAADFTVEIMCKQCPIGVEFAKAQ